MTEQMDKFTLLNSMRSGYKTFEAEIDALSEEQLTTPGVNSTWSIKDNLAHLSQWQKHMLTNIQAIEDGVEPPNPTAGLNEDQSNELYYQENKTRSLTDVREEFRTVSQALIERVQGMSNADLNRPIPWLNNRPVWPYIEGNTFEHYAEHRQIIQAWLTRTES